METPFHLPTIIMVVEHPDSNQLGSSSAQLLNFIHYFTSSASSNYEDSWENNNLNSSLVHDFQLNSVGV